MMLVARYFYGLILGPTLIIILAASIALLVKFPSLKPWIGVAMAIIGAVEVSYVPPVFVVGAEWLLLVSIATLDLGIIMCVNVFLPHKWRAKIGLFFITLGIVEILCSLFFLPILFSLFYPLFDLGACPFWFLGFVAPYPFWFWGFVVGICTLVFGVAAGASAINPQRTRAQIGVVLTAVGACIILLGIYTTMFTYGYLFVLASFGLSTALGGISVDVAALPFWTQNQLKENKHHALRKAFYVLLAMVIVASVAVIFMRVTNVVHEQILATYNGGSTPNLILRGIITDIRLNYEVNDGYFYHIFPAYMVMNATEFVWGSGYASAPGATVVVYYEKTDVPSLAIGQRVQVCGYLNPPMEDSFYGGKLSVAPSISGSYVKPL
jgi:hypothetical protein